MAASMASSSSQKRNRQGPDGLYEQASLQTSPKKREKAETPTKGKIVPLPPISRYLPIVLGGSHWHARDSLENIVIFGDSYSRWEEGPTWVNHLQRYIQRQGYTSETHNFAFPGATVEANFLDQISSFTGVANTESNEKRLELDSEGTTYFVFLGINDCGTTECDGLECIVEKIFGALHHLYVNARARNFVLIDIPAIERSPQAIDSEVAEEIEDRVKTWNDLLQQQLTEFGLTNKDGTLFLFSSHRLLMDVLDDPLEYDFSEDDVTSEVGGIWADDLHLTSEVHDLLGQQLLTALITVQC